MGKDRDEAADAGAPTMMAPAEGRDQVMSQFIGVPEEVLTD